jgi:hypothetical protein
MVRLGSVKVYIAHFFFVYQFRVLAFNTSAHEMLYILLYFRLVESLSYGHPFSFFPTMSCHRHIMFLLPILCIEDHIIPS